MTATADLTWSYEARCGMFIHWGPYSAAGRGEWVLNRENIPFEEHLRKYVNNFRAERYNSRQWVRLAQDAGMLINNRSGEPCDTQCSEQVIKPSAPGVA